MKNNNYIENVTNACSKIAPLWSLDNFVAVNPFLGFIDQSFELTAQQFSAAASTNMVMPLSFYVKNYQSGNILDKNIQLAYQKITGKALVSVPDFIAHISEKEELDSKLLVVMDIAEKLSNCEWTTFIPDRITNWASAYFDKGQALWLTSNQESSVFESWLADAKHDKSPEIAGLINFKKNISKLPSNADDAIAFCLAEINVPQSGIENYLFSLLMRVSGWSSYCAGLDWQLKLKGKKADHTKEFLAILLAWEWSFLKDADNSKLQNYWKQFKPKFAASNPTSSENALQKQLVFQLAYEYGLQQSLISEINSQKNETSANQSQKVAQAVFCIDVRSEVFRRNLELVDQDIQTRGFAGFFGMPVEYFPVAQEEGENQCPVLLHPPFQVEDSYSSGGKYAKASKTLKAKEQFHKAFKSFKSGAISGFGFVSAIGLTYIQKLVRDSLAIYSSAPKQKKENSTTDEKDIALKMSLEQQLNLGKSALKTMSLTDGFSKFILFVGHGSTSVNNPHASGLDCGACGGRTGEINAKVAAKILNNEAVRTELKKDNIVIPEETVFVAGLHDTTTDLVTFYNLEKLSESDQKAFEKIQASFQKAGQAARTERATRFNMNNENANANSIFSRSKDWSQIRPEWGLAGCNAFVVAPRHRSQGVSLNSKSFLHDYTWKKDEGFSVLTTIMTAPMIVTSWINLQYYASTVDNEKLGAGNKTLHNVVGGFGVIEGHSGDLRVGLPMQSIHDGKQYQNAPSRLNVIIEAPLDAINLVIKENKMVQDLCDNGWIHLLAMDDKGKVNSRYEGNGKWINLIDVELKNLVN